MAGAGPANVKEVLAILSQEGVWSAKEIRKDINVSDANLCFTEILQFQIAKVCSFLLS